MGLRRSRTSGGNGERPEAKKQARGGGLKGREINRDTLRQTIGALILTVLLAGSAYLYLIQPHLSKKATAQTTISDLAEAAQRNVEPLVAVPNVDRPEATTQRLKSLAPGVDVTVQEVSTRKLSGAVYAHDYALAVNGPAAQVNGFVRALERQVYLDKGQPRGNSLARAYAVKDLDMSLADGALKGTVTVTVFSRTAN